MTLSPPSIGRRNGRPRAGRALRLACLVLILAVHRSAAEVSPSDRSAVHVFAEPRDAVLAKRAGRVVETALGELAAELGISPPKEVTVLLVHGHAALEAECGRRLPEWTIAIALADRDALAVDVARALSASPNDLRVTLRHEAVHLLLFRVERERPGDLPLWFHEGLAQYLSGSALFPGGRETFVRAAARGRLLPFDTLEDRFPDSSPAAVLAYLQSEAFVSHVVRHGPEGALRRLIGDFREGASFGEAFSRAFGRRRERWEADWKAGLRRSLPWWRFAGHPTTLFIFMALLTVLVFVVVHLRARRQRMAWEREEREFTVLFGDDDEDGE